MSSLFLAEDLDDSAFEAGSAVTLGREESRHAVTVNRLRVGETVSVGNGRGVLATGTVTTADAAALVIGLERVERLEPSNPRITLVQALAKGDRDELAIQAATELGVDAVVPWAARRSVKRWEGAKIEKSRERWATIVREATKQSIRAWVPEVRALHSTGDLARLAGSTRMLVLEPTAHLPLTQLARRAQGAEAAHAAHGAAEDTQELVLVVGPEGGISPEELELLERAGATSVRLGASVLRTSTAGPAALAVLNAGLGRW
ncbi:16S rRNA (uracil(1498)-N(3))-methyltransferase [Compostimonas suwonensis]|uniref:Ribosomal RNA small subunit methyltransferase E n=1 Tax=Compostimonas suwonensis TaxID=1048394 RepID=A0A2M9BZ68_9MICO|nr:16S rRNA (uracil(1498)-N(3))-methyltransferase [Compostimonas suwonensis]PJJ63360.1 16S rRNA (uracil1498-N3)-methyltransferase [Compostimonas suwonensis]